MRRKGDKKPPAFFDLSFCILFLPHPDTTSTSGTIPQIAKVIHYHAGKSLVPW